MKKIKKFDEYLDSVKKNGKINSGSSFMIQGKDANKLASSLLDFMETEGVSFKKEDRPNIKFTRKKQKETPFFRETGHYIDPTNEITIYTNGRSLKDCLRSLAHEIIHADQKINKGIEITKASNGISGKSKDVENIEGDAYRRGNLIFRKWEESLKNEIS